MTAPIIIFRPRGFAQPLDANGDPTGSPTEFTDDVSVVELGVATPTTTVATWAGKFTIPGDIEESARFSFVINPDTDGRWAPLVGLDVEFQIYDRNNATQYRKFTSLVSVNPSVYGATQPGEARSVDIDFPVLSAIAWETYS